MKMYSTTLELELNTEAAAKLKEIAYRKRAFLQSDSPIYPLSSGKMSDHYFEGKRITLSSEGARHVATMVLEEIEDLNVDAIGGLVIGAALIVSSVAAIAAERGKQVDTFIVREQPKGHGTQRKVEGYLQEGWRVAIVDDVITSGESVLKAVKAVEDLNCEVVKVIALVDRHEGGSDLLRKKGYSFQQFLNLKPSGEVTIGEPTEAASR